MKSYDKISLGILAGGRASRLNGADKAFIRYQNEYLSQRILCFLDMRFSQQLISTRVTDPRFIGMNLMPVHDSRPSFSGPLAGIEALLDATQSEYLLSIPVDVKYVPGDLIEQWLETPELPGQVLHDADGLQPLFALWHVRSCRTPVKSALDQGITAVHSVISQLNFKIATRTDIQIGNLNTPRDFETT
ncbi:MAG: molybdenum cofactor guanylyltransferase [Arenimonas sp.]